MGGLGSGRTDYATTPTVRECRALDVNTFTDAVTQPGRPGTVRWGDSDAPDAEITIGILGDRDDERATALGLAYTQTDRRTGDTAEYAYRVPFDYTDCHFGGVRPWFRCPGRPTGDPCDERVGKLYCPPGGTYFLCRHCHALGYRSSRAAGDAITQAELRYRRAYAALDPADRRPHPASGDVPAVPSRPPGMHRATYAERVAALEAARVAWDDAHRAELARLASARRG